MFHKKYLWKFSEIEKMPPDETPQHESDLDRDSSPDSVGAVVGRRKRGEKVKVYDKGIDVTDDQQDIYNMLIS